MPDALPESMAIDLHASVDSTTAVATVVTGRVESEIGSVRGKLFAGRHPPTTRFLEGEAGRAPRAAAAMVARGRDLRTHSAAVADAWLAGEITGDSIRELTLGASVVIRRSSVPDTAAALSCWTDGVRVIAPREGTARTDGWHAMS